MRRAAQEAKKTETSKQFEFTTSISYLLFYNAAQALGSVSLTGAALVNKAQDSENSHPQDGRH